MLVAAVGSAICMGLLMVFPQAMFPNSEITGLEWLLPITIIALAWSDVMLSALAYLQVTALGRVGESGRSARRRGGVMAAGSFPPEVVEAVRRVEMGEGGG